MISAVAVGNPAKDLSRRFYSWMALSCLLVSVIGFTPTYFVGMARGQFSAPPIVHLHGMVMFAWVAFFCIQTRLIAQGATLAHRTWGMVGIAIITAMACTTIAVMSMRITQAADPAQAPGTLRAVAAFSWVSFSGILYVCTAFVIAIAKVKRTDVHKRLMVLLTISMLGAPIARWFILFLAPAVDPSAPTTLPSGAPILFLPQPEFTIPPALIGDLLLVAAMVFDKRQLGRVHPTYLIGGAVLLTIQLTIGWVARSDAWNAVAMAIGRLV